MLRADELPLRDGGLSFTDAEPAPEIGPTCPGAPSFSRVPFSRGSEWSPFACGDDASFCEKQTRKQKKFIIKNIKSKVHPFLDVDYQFKILGNILRKQSINTKSKLSQFQIFE